MERRAFQTPLGEVWLWGEWPDGRRYQVLLVHGLANKPRPLLQSVQRHIPQTELKVAHLPGNHCPELRSCGIAAYARVLDSLLDSRLTIVIGTSLGALVALKMRAPQIRRLLLIEPPLTAIENPALQARVAPFLEGEEDFTSDLLQVQIPTWVMVGDQTNGPGLPTLVSDKARSLLKAHPRVRYILVEAAGHNVVEAAPAGVVSVVQALVRDLIGTDKPDQDPAVATGCGVPNLRAS